MKKILLIGANSYVAKALARELIPHFHVLGTYHNQKNANIKEQVPLDITNAAEVSKVISQINPEIIIVPAGISTDNAPVERIRETNITAVQHIVDATRALKNHPTVVLFSTEQVFGGSKSEYTEGDEPDPVNEYGKSKAAAEKIVRAYDPHLIVRLSAVLGPKEADDHHNFLTKFAAGELPSVFSDVYRRPIYIKDAARAIAFAIQHDVRGTLHVTGNTLLSYEAMAALTAKFLHRAPTYSVSACTNPSVPRRLVLSNEALRARIPFELHSFEEMLRDCAKKLTDPAGHSHHG